MVRKRRLDALPCTLGTLDLDLNAMLEPARSASDILPELDLELESEQASNAFCCCVNMVPKLAEEDKHEVKLIDLFEKKKIKGWWPIYNKVRDLNVSRQGGQARSEGLRAGGSYRCNCVVDVSV